MNKTLHFGRFYHGKRVFVTGHSGFKGTWLKVWLEQLGATVCGYSDRIGWDHAEPIRRIGDLNALTAAITEAAPDIVMHLAAQALVSEGYEEPLYTLETNVIGTANLLDILRKRHFKGRVIVVTSDKVYAPREPDQNPYGPGPFKEDDRLGGKDPYSLSKAAAELVCDAYRGYSLDIVTVRGGNVIGGGDWSTNRIVPDCVRSLMALRPVEVRAPGSTRPFQYVLDCLSGYLLAGCVGKCPPRINFGPEDSHRVQDLVVEFLRAWGSGSWTYAEQPFAEVKALEVSSELARKELRWAPVLNFRETVKETADWYAAIQGGAQPQQAHAAWIERYCVLAEQRQAVWTQDELSDLTP